MAPETDGKDPGEELDLYFAAARADGAGPAPSDDLMARILADAAAVQPRPATQLVETRPRTTGTTGFAAVLATLGGWPAAAGLAAMAGVGVLVGLSPPAAISAALEGAALVGLGADDSTASMLAGYDAYFLGDG